MADSQFKNPYEGQPPPYLPPMGEAPYSMPSPPPPGPMYAPPPPGAMYPPPPNAMYPPPPIPTVIVQPTSVYLGHNPQPMQCPSCGQQILTQVRYDPGAFTFLAALLICFFGGIFGCCLIPFCVPGCQDATHTCPACRARVGQRSPL